MARSQESPQGAGMPASGPAAALAPPSEPGRDTAERLLDAAEALFAERGFEGTSLRAVTQAAGTSVSAAHYHFGGKEALLRATLRRRVEPMNRLRLERLEALRRRSGGRALAVEEILDAFLRPLFDLESARAEARFVAARLYSDPPELVAALKEELFGEVSRRFLEALAEALPARPREEIALGFHFAVGAMVHVLSGNLEDAPAEARDVPSERATVLQHLVAFLAAGLRSGRRETRP